MSVCLSCCCCDESKVVVSYGSNKTREKSIELCMFLVEILPDSTQISLSFLAAFSRASAPRQNNTYVLSRNRKILK